MDAGEFDILPLAFAFTLALALVLVLALALALAEGSENDDQDRTGGGRNNFKMTEKQFRILARDSSTLEWVLANSCAYA